MTGGVLSALGHWMVFLDEMSLRMWLVMPGLLGILPEGYGALGTFKLWSAFGSKPAGQGGCPLLVF